MSALNRHQNLDIDLEGGAEVVCGNPFLSQEKKNTNPCPVFLRV